MKNNLTNAFLNGYYKTVARISIFSRLIEVRVF